MDTYDEVYEKGENSEKKIIHKGNEEILQQDRWSHGSYNTSNALIPGRYHEGGITKYNDEIHWVLCSLQDPHSHQTTAYVGFKFPYLVIDYEAHSVSPYYNRNNGTANFVNEDLIIRDDDQSHPYYQHHSISIPKGIKGDTFKNLRVVPAYAGIEDYEGKQDDIDNEREVLVYTYFHYDKDGNGEPVDIYLGDYNMIEDINITRMGRLTIEYTHGDTYETTLRWVSDIDTDENGIITLYYTTGETKTLSGQINFIKEVVVTDDYHLIMMFSDPDYMAELEDEGLTYTYQGREWYDLGSIKDDSGMLVGLNVDPDEHPGTETIAGAISYLNETYPNGLEGIDLKGKLVTVGKYNEDKTFYCFDYTQYEWYYIGGIQAGYAVVGREDDPSTRAAAANMPVGGLWFVVKD